MANRRYVHPGQSQVIGHDRRDYKAMNTATAGISVAGFDTALIEPDGYKPVKAKSETHDR